MKKKKKSSENNQLTGHFQSFFSEFFLGSFSELFFFRAFFLISPEKNSNTSKVNQLYVLNL